MKVIKILKYLGIAQEVSNLTRIHALGKGFRTAKRLNPYNPLSYIVIILIFIGGILAFGFIGFWHKIDLENPFKWS